ncbi:unnamed protein product, partial [Urochloa humidicola]
GGGGDGGGGDPAQSGGGGAAVRPGGKPPRGLQEDDGPRGLEEDKTQQPLDGATAAVLEEDKTQQPLDGGATAAGLEEEESQQPLDGAIAADADTITPWKLRTFNTGKPAPPGPTRVITAPRMTAPAQEMWTRAATTREQVSYAVELENLSSSVATIGSGVGKLCTGFGLKIMSQEEKEAAAAMEKKAIEEKNVAQELLAAEEKLAAAKLNDSEMEWKKKKEEERRKEEEQAKKERSIALLLSIPGHLVNISSVLNGLGEIACGTKGVLISMSLMVRSVPSLARRVRATTENWIWRSSSKCCRMGTGSLGFRMALDRQIVTRASDGRVSVLDSVGSNRERVPRALGGALIITNEEELYQAIADFRSGRLSQLIDIDEKLVTSMMACNMWRVLCSERLCGLLCPDSLLPEMALRAGALMDEEIAVKGHLRDAENAVKDAMKAVKEHQSTVNDLQARLHKSKNGVVVPKVEKP